MLHWLNGLSMLPSKDDANHLHIRLKMLGTLIGTQMSGDSMTAVVSFSGIRFEAKQCQEGFWSSALL